MTKENHTVFEFEDVTVDPRTFRVWKAGHEVLLEPKTLQVLIYFLENRDRLIEKGELLDAIWKDTFVTENAMTREIAKLRRALGDDPKTPRFIQTVHTQGYRFVAPVSEVGDDASTSVQGSTSTPLKGRRVKAGVFSGIVAIAILAFAFLAWNWLAPSTETTRFSRPTQITTWTSLDIYPALSPDGTSVAYSSDHEGSFEIYVKPLAGGANEIRLTSDGQHNFQPAFSPSGAFIAFYSKNAGGIWTIPATGGRVKQLSTFGSNPKWSPDGSRIVFQSDPIIDLGALSPPAQPPSTLWVVAADGSTAPTPITRVGHPAGGHGAPAWSPNGKRIVFCVSDWGTTSLWSVATDGGEPTQVAGVTLAFDPTYSPDGQSVYYVTLSGLWKMRVSPATGEPLGEPIRLTASSSERIRHPSVSADGAKIAYATLSLTSNMWSVNPGSSGSEAPVQLTQDRSLRNSLPAFSPDGKRIAFNTQNVSREGEGEIWLMDSDGRNRTQLTTEGGGLASWFPDGEQILFSSVRDRTKGWTIGLRTGQERQIFSLGEDVNYLRLSPDGNRVVFNSKRSGTTNVWTLSVSGGEAKQLTFDEELMAYACWSPDGRTLAFNVKRGDDTHLCVMPSEGGPITQLTFDKGQSWAHSFSPDGDKIAFAGFRNGLWNLYWVSQTTKGQLRLTNYTKLNAYVRYPAWSPLDDKIVFEYAETTGNIWIADLE